MKKFFKFLFSSLLIGIILIAVTLVACLAGAQQYFADTYQRSIQIKYNYMMTTDTPKIIVIGGSSAAFGFDSDVVEEETGYKLCNLGVMANLGPKYTCEMALANLNPGDIVLVATEYEFLLDYGNFRSINTKILLSGAGNDYELYKYLDARQALSAVGDIFDFMNYKLFHVPEGDVYNIKSFDKTTGNMIYDRSNRYYVTTDETPTLDLNDYTLPDEVVEYLKEYKERVEEKGAQVYIVPPAISKYSIKCDYSLFENLKEELQTKTGITYVGDPTDFFYEDTDMYDGYYHLTDTSDDDRTEKVIEGLRQAGALE